jgi:diguanylate cyclase (GGDEF)-like protein/PAS domain S-box-containing protein
MLEQQVRQRTKKLEQALRENERITRNLRASEATFRGLVNQSLIGIAITEGGTFTYTNPKFDAIFGYSAAEMRSLSPVDLATGRDRRRVANQVRRRINGEVDAVDYTFQGLRKDGTIITVEIHGSVVTVEGKRSFVTLALDITERMRAERQVQELNNALQRQVMHDPLTGLHNRRYLEETLRRELIRAKRQGIHVSAIISDIDHFKTVNDRYGHAAGDEVLRVFGRMLISHSRGSDVYCRYGGEEFLLIMPDMTESIACDRAERLRNALAGEEVKVGTTKIPVTASFGVATFPVHAGTGEDLIADADAALYAAKKAGRNRVVSYSTLATPCLVQ